MIKTTKRSRPTNEGKSEGYPSGFVPKEVSFKLAHSNRKVSFRVVMIRGVRYALAADLVYDLGMDYSSKKLARSKYGMLPVPIRGLKRKMSVINLGNVSGWLRESFEKGWVPSNCSSLMWANRISQVHSALLSVPFADPVQAKVPTKQVKKPAAAAPVQVSLQDMEKKYLVATATAKSLHKKLLDMAVNMDSWTLREAASFLMVGQKDLITALAKEGLIKKANNGKWKSGTTSLADRFCVETSDSVNTKINPKMYPFLKGLVERHSIKQSALA